ncbi:MAG: SIMPL domain-containing protein [Proteobacteria bacterium]|nr:SIMPL domain-containing protein [Pseudomonadota bacterium]
MPAPRLALLYLGVLAPLAALPAAAAEPPAMPTRSVTVSGHGEVRAAPDTATVTLGILARDPKLDVARREANRVMAALQAVARELKIPDADLRSTRLSVSPEFEGGGKTPRRLTAYRIERQLVVVLHDLERLGDLLDRGLAAGANLASDPELDSGRRAELEREALARAVADARENAATVARALGASLGAPREVAQNGAAVPAPMQMKMMALAGAAAPPVYQPGELSFTSEVSASFDLVPGPAAK